MIESKISGNHEIEIWGDGTVVRDYIHVQDIVSALIKAALYKETSVVEADGTPSNLRKRKVKETKEDENKNSDSASGNLKGKISIKN